MLNLSDRDNEARRKAFWDPVPLAVIPFFADLREAVLGGDLPPKRMPKWYWRLADDLALLLQPKDGRHVLFAGTVLQGADLTRASFSARRTDRRVLGGWWELGFWIVPGPTADGWRFRPSLLGAPRGASLRDGDGKERLRDRVLAALTPEVFADVDAVELLLPQCLICGKALTDPVSQARWIGPECAGQQRALPPSLEARVQRLRAAAQGALL
jgi:hypothetical protein